MYEMQSLSTIEYLEVAPLLPASVALTYIAFVRFDWEKSINRRFMRRMRNSDQKEFKPQSLLPIDKSPSRSLEVKQKPFRSHILNAVLPILHTNLTVGRLWGVDRSKRVSINFCAIQLALIVAEYALDGLRHRNWKRMDLLLLGVSWLDMGIQTTSTKYPVWDMFFSLIIAVIGIASVLLPDTEITSTATSKQLAKEGLLDHSFPEPGPSMRQFHIFSVSLLLVHLLHDYPVLSSWLLDYAPWMGSFSPFWIPFGLIYLHTGVQEWYKTHQNDQTFLQHVQAFISQVYTLAPQELLCGIILPLLTLGTWLLLFFAASYLTSCLGFRYLFLGCPRTTPQFLDGGRSGGYLYAVLTVVHLLRRGERIKADRPDGAYHFGIALIVAFGQSVTAVTVVALIAYMVREFY
jgi:hypothetical protein